MGALKFSLSHGSRSDGGNPQHVLARLIQQSARALTVGVAALTDNSGGVAASPLSPLLRSTRADTINVAASGSNLAAKAGTETALTAVVAAYDELFAKSKELALIVGADVVDYTPGATDGVVGAIGNSGAGAATGVQAAALNATLAKINNLQSAVAGQIDRVAVAVGGKRVDALKAPGSAPAGAVVVSGGNAGTPGVAKAVVDDKLVRYAANVATLAAALNRFRGAASPQIVVTP